MATTVINLHIDIGMLAEIDEKAGPQKRAEWIREAIRQRLERERADDGQHGFRGDQAQGEEGGR